MSGRMESGLRSPTVRAVAAISAAIFADSLLYSAVVPVLPAYAARHGASASAIGVLFASYAVALLLATPFVGAVSQRVGDRAVVIAGMVGVTGATVAFAAADSYVALVAARSTQGVAAAAVWTSGVALVAGRVKPSGLGQAMGVVVASMSAGMLAGPPVAGALVQAFGFRAPFLILASAAALCGLVQLALPTGPVTGLPQAAPLRTLLSSGRFRTTLAGVVVSAAALSMLEPLLPLDLAARLGAGAAVIGVVFGAGTLAHLAASPLVGRLSDRHDRVVLALTGLVAMAVVIPFAGSAPTPLATAGVLVAFAVAFSFVIVPALPEIADVVRTGGGSYAAAYGLFNIAYALGMVAGPTAGSALAGATSLTTALVTAGGALAVTAVVLASAPHRRPTWSCVVPPVTTDRSE